VSWVANLIVVAGPEDSDVADLLSEWLRADAPRRDGYSGELQPLGVGYLRLIADPDQNQWGGWKNPECKVWAGALSHADIDALLDFVARLPWSYPGRLQLLVMDQE
jgi:hypothetical protein